MQHKIGFFTTLKTLTENLYKMFAPKVYLRLAKKFVVVPESSGPPASIGGILCFMFLC